MIAVITISVLLIIFNAALFISLVSLRTANKNKSEALPISIIIAARNEEKNIPVLIRSLNEQNYPKDKYEVIIVDDNSADNTLEVIKRNIPQGLNLKYYSIRPEEKELPAKKGVLIYAVKKTNFPYILVTDADCRPSKNWLRSFSSKFSEGYDVLFGAAPFFKRDGLINKISRFENLRSGILTFAAAELKFPYSAAARSFGYTRTAYDKLNGYHSVSDAIAGDDDLFIREAVKAGMEIGTVVDADSFVYSETASSLPDYLKQKARHLSVSGKYLFAHQLILGAWHGLNLAALLFILLSFVSPIFLLLPLVKIICDTFLAVSSQKKFGYNFRLYEILYLQFIYEIFIIINYINGVLKPVKWK
jgi:cellulose synthase/poly-beta-1,6-N-acetylglucosamine synthase-like glycosyltransferase